MRKIDYGQAVIIGGGNGIGASFANKLSAICDKVVVVDKVNSFALQNNCEFFEFDLIKDDYSSLEPIIKKSKILVITAGIGRVDYFDNMEMTEIIKTINVDFTATIKLINLYYSNLKSADDAYCLVMGSLAGDISSPLFSVYGGCKAGINKIIESLNIELESIESSNRILNVKPISFKGTSFNGKVTCLEDLEEITNDCLDKMFKKETYFIPDYDKVCSDILKRYNDNPHEFGLSSLNYKISNNRISKRKMVKIGYMSGTFDLFHIGHLNIIKRAKRMCDYLIVGVHPDGSHKGKETFISFEERKEIVKSLKYVDEVVTANPDDSAAWKDYKYDYLFVGSDYKGTEKFLKYEEYFSDKGVEIVYFPYTNGTSSSQLRDALTSLKK